MKISKSLIIVGVIIVAIVLIGAWFVNTRNGFVTLDEDVQQQWGKVEVQYQRRLDLIPNLVETVKGYAAHESSTFEKVTQARAGLTDAYNKANALQGQDAAATEQSLDSYNAAQQGLGKALSIYVNAVREAYPDLKANTNFMNLQEQLESTENRIATERRRYNEEVETYNKKVLRFPGSIWASMFNFDPKDMFQAEEGANKAPKVEF